LDPKLVSTMSDTIDLCAINGPLGAMATARSGHAYGSASRMPTQSREHGALFNWLVRGGDVNKPIRKRATAARNPSSRRRGVALLLCLFVLSIISVWTVNIFQCATVYQSALRNNIDYEKSLYLANAGVHHALAELEADLGWRSTVSDGSYPSSGSYSATAVNGSAAGTVEITSTGVSGGATRRVTATILVE
jgi:hypothetical protein